VRRARHGEEAARNTLRQSRVTLGPGSSIS
jgi:hypothetical protein